jgi:hypothetical protein
VYRSEIKHGVRPTITESCVIQALADDNQVFNSLVGKTVVSRSFPSPEKLTVEIKNTLSKVLEDGYILFDELDNGIRSCYEHGWIHRAITMESTKWWRNICVLPSRLHEK